MANSVEPDGTAVSSGSTLFAHVSFLVCRAKMVNVIMSTTRSCGGRLCRVATDPGMQSDQDLRSYPYRHFVT